MLPLRDHNPSSRFPFITYSIIAVCAAIWLYEYFVVGAPGIEAFFDAYALHPGEVSRGAALGTIFSSMFLHGSWLHFIGNMLFLKIFGDNLEDRMGHFPFLLFYILTGVAAAIFQVVLDTESMVPMVGASGAIAGVMGGYLLLYPKAKVDVLVPAGFGIVAMPAIFMLGYWFIVQLISGTVMGSVEGGGVAYGAHIGGFIAGFALIIPWWIFKPKARFIER